MKNEKKVNDTLRMMSNKGEISKETVKRLQAPPNATRTPLFYGNVKSTNPTYHSDQ